MSDYHELFDKDFRENQENMVLTHNAIQRQAKARGLIKGIKNGKALDVGCADGLFANALRIIGHETWGIDISQNAIQKAKANFPSCNFQVGNLTEIPFLDSTFDLVTCLDTIYYLNDAGRKKAVDEFARVLKPNGYLLISTSWPWHTKTRTGTSYMTGTKVRLLLGKHFRLLRVVYTSTRLKIIPTGSAMLFKHEPRGGSK